MQIISLMQILYIFKESTGENIMAPININTIDESKSTLTLYLKDIFCGSFITYVDINVANQRFAETFIVIRFVSSAFGK